LQAVAFFHPKWEETSRDSSSAPEKGYGKIRSPGDKYVRVKEVITNNCVNIT
jgi:hypothetical protein